MPTSQLTPGDLDALREVAEIGGRRATLALAQLIGEEASLHVSDVAVVNCDEIPAMLHEGDRGAAGLRFGFLGGARGTVLLVFPEYSARWLVGRLAPQAGDGDPGQEESILCEVGNILVSAYLSAMGDRCSLVLIPSVPALAYDRSEAVVEHLTDNLLDGVDQALLVTTRFSDSRGEAPGRLFLIPDGPSLTLIMGAIRAGGGTPR